MDSPAVEEQPSSPLQPLYSGIYLLQAITGKSRSGSGSNSNLQNVSTLPLPEDGSSFAKVVDYWPLKAGARREVLAALPSFCFPHLNSNSQPTADQVENITSHHFVLTSAVGERSYFYVALLTVPDSTGRFKHMALCFQSTNRAVQTNLFIAEDILRAWWEGAAIFQGSGLLMNLCNVPSASIQTAHQSFLSPSKIVASLAAYHDINNPRPYRYLSLTLPAPLSHHDAVISRHLSLEWCVESWEDLTEAPPPLTRLIAPPADLPCIRLLLHLSPENLMLAFEALLFEGRVVFFSRSPAIVSSAIEALIQLITPLQWLHTMIPCLPFDQTDILEAPTPYLIGVVSSFMGSPDEDRDSLEHLATHLAASGCLAIMLDDRKIVQPRSQLEKQERQPRLPDDMRQELLAVFRQLADRALWALPAQSNRPVGELSDAMLRHCSFAVCKLLHRSLVTSQSVLGGTQAFSHFVMRTEAYTANIRAALKAIYAMPAPALSSSGPQPFLATVDPLSNSNLAPPPQSFASNGSLRRNRQNRGGGEWSLAGLYVASSPSPTGESSITVTTQLFSSAASLLNAKLSSPDEPDESFRVLCEMLISISIQHRLLVLSCYLLSLLHNICSPMDGQSDPPALLSDLYATLGGAENHDQIRTSITNAGEGGDQSYTNLLRAIDSSCFGSVIKSTLLAWVDALRQQEEASRLKAEVAPAFVLVSPLPSSHGSLPVESRVGPASLAAIRSALSELNSNATPAVWTPDLCERWLLDQEKLGYDSEEVSVIVECIRNSQLRRSEVSISNFVGKSSNGSLNPVSILAPVAIKNFLSSLQQIQEQLNSVSAQVPQLHAGYSRSTIVEESDSGQDQARNQLGGAEIWITSSLAPNSVFRLNNKQKLCFVVLTTHRLMIVQQQQLQQQHHYAVLAQFQLKHMVRVEKYSGSSSRKPSLISGMDRKGVTLILNDSLEAMETLIFPTQSQRDLWLKILEEMLWVWRLSRDLEDNARFLLRTARRMSIVASLHAIGAWSAGQQGAIAKLTRPSDKRTNTKINDTMFHWSSNPPLSALEMRSRLEGFLNVAESDPALSNSQPVAASETLSPNRVVLELLASVLSLFLSVRSSGSADLVVDKPAARAAEYASFEKSTSRLQQLDMSSLLENHTERQAFFTNLWNLMYMHGALRCRRVPSNALEYRYLCAFTTYVVGRLPLSLDTVLQLLRGGKRVLGSEMSHKQLSVTDFRTKWAIPDPDVDPRVHFVLAWFCQASPRINLLSASAEAFDNTLEQAARNYIERAVRVDLASRSISLPRLFYWFRESWSAETDILAWVTERLPADSSTRRELEKIRRNGGVSVVYWWDWDPSQD